MSLSLKCFAISVSFMAIASPALAAHAGSAGPKYEGLLLQVIIANQQGVCPADLMRAELKASCESQLPDLKVKFLNLGALKGVTYLGRKALEGGPGEVYKISFEHGDWTWTLNAQNDKEFIAYAPAPIWNVASYVVKPVQWQSR